MDFTFFRGGGKILTVQLYKKAQLPQIEEKKI